MTEKIEQKPPLIPQSQAEAESFASELGLRYVRDSYPGLHRLRKGRGFTYVDTKNKKIADPKLIERIQGLVIPPAWEEVWICPYKNGHLQVTGRDARHRKQYRYHEKWNEARNENKFEHLIDFGKVLPKIYDETEKDLKRQGLPKEKVLAAVVRVMDLTRIRVGNDAYAEENGSYGLTTMLVEQTQVNGSKVRFKFRGKSGIEHEVEFSDPRLSRIIKNCQDLPGEELFTYIDDNKEIQSINSSDVNSYLRDISGMDVTAKDFRTWGGSLKALELLLSLGPGKSHSETARKKRELEVIRSVAKYLRNTVSVCRKYYIHPTLFELDRSGKLHKSHGKIIKALGENNRELLQKTILKILAN